MLNSLVDSWRVTPFHHPKPIVCRYQSANPTQFFGSTAGLCKVALKARLQLCVGELHDPLNRSVAELVRGLPARQRRRLGSLPHDRSLGTSHSILWPNARPLPFRRVSSRFRTFRCRCTSNGSRRFSWGFTGMGDSFLLRKARHQAFGSQQQPSDRRSVLQGGASNFRGVHHAGLD